MSNKTKNPERIQVLSDMLGSSNEISEFVDGLTDTQKLVVRLRMRGLTTRAIAELLQVSTQRVHNLVSEIKDHYQNRGESINQAAVVGESLTLFEEVEQKAWEVYHTDESKKLRALGMVMSARERQIKLLMELGLLKRAAQEHIHGVIAPAWMSALSPQKRQEIVELVMTTQPGEEPEPPVEDEDLPKLSSSNLEVQDNEDYSDKEGELLDDDDL